jgi:DNA-3-methyladenine glycosylase I
MGPGRRPRAYRYHDIEWATATHSPAALFETLTLGVFQAGLGWLTVFHKRDAFREAFKGFEPEEVARMVRKDVELLLGNKGIIRNRAKIEATVHNARLVTDGKNSLDSLAWAVVPGRHPRPRRWADVPSNSPDSVILSKALRAAVYRFIGPITEPEGGGVSSGSEGQRQGVQRLAHAPDGHERGPDWAGEQAGRYGRVTGAGPCL